jgi:secondary thiamine-phosphate synthase enzyme
MTGRLFQKRAFMIHQSRIALSTRGYRHMQDITQELTETIARSHVETGIAHLFNIGSTAALGTIEFEPGLQADFPEMLDRLIPPSRDYGHEQTWHDGNGHSHLQASLLGPSISIPIAQNRPVLGTWQQVFHLECDNKPRQREIVVTILGE